MTYWLSNAEAFAGADNDVINTGSGGNAVLPNFWTSKLTSGTGTITYDAASDTIELKATTASSAAQLRRTGLDQAIMNVEVECEGIVTPTSANCRLIEFRNVGDTTYIGKLSIKTDGHLIWENAANATVWTSTNALPTGAGWRVWAGVEKGTTTSNGKIRVYVYTTSDGKSATSLESYTTDAGNTGTGNVGGVYLGWSSGGYMTLQYRNCQMEDASLAAIGTYTATSITMDWSRYIVQYLDFSTSTGTGLTLDVTQDSGPAVSITTSGLVSYFPDTASRTTPVVLTATLTDSSANEEAVTITIPTPLRRSGPLVKLSGAWT